MLSLHGRLGVGFDSQSHRYSDDEMYSGLQIAANKIKGDINNAIESLNKLAGKQQEMIAKFCITCDANGKFHIEVEGRKTEIISNEMEDAMFLSHATEFGISGLCSDHGRMNSVMWINFDEGTKIETRLIGSSTEIESGCKLMEQELENGDFHRFEIFGDAEYLKKIARISKKCGINVMLNSKALEEQMKTAIVGMF